MFKKNEESEWTRFSRALGGTTPPAAEDEAPADDRPEEAVTLAQMPAAEPETYEPPAHEPAPDRDEAPSFIAPPPTVATPAFTQTPPRVEPVGADETVIGEGASIEGTVRSDRSIRVRGAVQGEIESKQQVVVEESAKVSAKIVAEHVTVLGEVDGSVECSGRLEIASSARVTGEVSASTLVIQEGAFFEGTLRMSSLKEPAGTV
jgi:cytoskeletal protein CcmA (bactofilin family)